MPIIDRYCGTDLYNYLAINSENSSVRLGKPKGWVEQKQDSNQAQTNKEASGLKSPKKNAETLQRL